MSDKKITDLPLLTDVDDPDQIEVVDQSSGNSSRATIATISDAVGQHVNLISRLANLETGDIPEFNAKGDIIVATGADTGARVPIGTDGSYLVADPTSAFGVRWQRPVRINVEDPPFNASPSNTASQNATAINAALAAGTDNQVYFPRLYNVNAQLQEPHGNCDIAGAGRGISGVTWTTDLGAGVKSLNDYSDSFSNIHDLKLTAPNPSGAQGTVGTAMQSFRTCGKGVYKNLIILNFYSAIEIAADHEILDTIFMSGNYYGLYWGPKKAGTTGNQTINAVDNDWARMAAWAVNPNNVCEAVAATECHIGFAPYGIMRESGGVSLSAWINGSSFNKCIFEGIGNSTFYAQGFLGYFGNASFFDCDSVTTPNLTYQAASQPKDYGSIYVEKIDNVHCYGSLSLFALEGDYGWIKAKYITDFTHDDAYGIGLARVKQGIGTGDIASGTNTILNVSTTSGAFVNNALITSDDGYIPAGTTITNITGSTITLSANTTGTIVGGAIRAQKPWITQQDLTNGYVRRSGGKFDGAEFILARWVYTGVEVSVRDRDLVATFDEQSWTSSNVGIGERVDRLNSSPPRGVTLAGTGIINQIIPVVTKGPAEVSTPSAVAARNYLKPHTNIANRGQVDIATLGTDHPIIGVAKAAVSNGRVLAEIGIGY